MTRRSSCLNLYGSMRCNAASRTPNPCPNSRKAGCGQTGLSKKLRPLHKTIDHLLLAGLLERDGELVAVDLDHVTVAEFLVKDAVVEREFRSGPGGFGHQFAFDHHGPALVPGECVVARVLER